MPKALVRVGGAPLLEHVIRRLIDAGCSRMVVNVHHFASQITDYLDAHNYGVDIYVSDEQSSSLIPVVVSSELLRFLISISQC